jgi:hypothetical protein
MSYEILIQQGFWMHLSKEAISNPLCFTTSPEEPTELPFFSGLMDKDDDIFHNAA